MTVQELMPTSSRTSRIEVDDDSVVPGSYWRLVEAQPRERSDYAQHDDLPADLILLVERVERVLEGDLHSVHLAPHPEWPENSAGVGLEVAAFDAGDGVEIVRVEQRGGAALWAVRCQQLVLSIAGVWDCEPVPSARSRRWIANHRFQSPEAALAALEAEREASA